MPGLTVQALCRAAEEAGGVSGGTGGATASSEEEARGALEAGSLVAGEAVGIAAEQTGSPTQVESAPALLALGPRATEGAVAEVGLALLALVGRVEEVAALAD